MTAQGGDLLAWLETAIAQRERTATLAAVSLAGSSNGGKWDQRRDQRHGGYMIRRAAIRPGTTTPPLTDAVGERVALTFGESEAAHIIVNDPETVLRRCAADRELLSLHRPDSDDRPECVTCGPQYPCRTVRVIAEGYGCPEDENAPAGEPPCYQRKGADPAPNPILTLLREVLDHFTDWPGGFPWPEGDPVAHVSNETWDRWSGLLESAEADNRQQTPPTEGEQVT